MSYSEELCEKSLKLIFRDSIEIIRNYRPNWLKNPITGKNLEIDFYIPHIGLCIEIQGEHHYNDNEQIQRDSFKRQKIKDSKQILLELSILQINPAHLWGKIRKCVFKHNRIPFLRDFQQSWLNIKEYKDYKQKIKNLYPNSNSIFSPYINECKQNKIKMNEYFDKNVLLNIELNCYINNKIVRVTPIEVMPSNTVRCRILGTNTIIFARKNKLFC